MGAMTKEGRRAVDIKDESLGMRTRSNEKHTRSASPRSTSFQLKKRSIGFGRIASKCEVHQKHREQSYGQVCFRVLGF
jgi:hypothetical protein